jgi:AmmeMemoRadiSam system protein B
MKTVYFHAITLAILLFISTGGTPIEGEPRDKEEVRSPVVAGTYYPNSPNELRRMINILLDSVQEIKPAGKILSAVAPHAGYLASGKVAAYTHKILSTIPFDTLIIIGHDTYQDALAYTCPVDYFQTPLGNVPVDREMMEKMLRANPRIKASRSIFRRDHTIEIQLPFLQVLGRECKIIPILFGRPSVKNCRALTDAILAAAGNKTVFVLSSTDMSHYPSYDHAYKVDNATLEVLKALDLDKLFAHFNTQERRSSVPNLDTALCAKGGLGTALLYAEALGADHVQILRYANSGDIPEGDKRGVVGYSSVLMVKKSFPITGE